LARAGQPVEEPADDFSDFRWHEIAKNRITVDLEIDRLWNTLSKGQFPPTGLAASESNTHSKKLRAMKDQYKIDERAIKDFDLLQGLTKDMPRSASVLAYNKSEALKAYLSKLSPGFWTSLTTLLQLSRLPPGYDLSPKGREEVKPAWKYPHGKGSDLPAPS
jgi:hypothetical protein